MPKISNALMIKRHPLTGRELRALRRMQRDQASKSPFVFVSERGTPFSKRGFQIMVERAALAAGFDMKIHPHKTSSARRTIQSTFIATAPSMSSSSRRNTRHSEARGLRNPVRRGG